MNELKAPKPSSPATCWTVRDTLFVVTLAGLALLIPVAVWTVGTHMEWIYWTVGAITVFGRIGTLWYPSNEKGQP